MKVTIPIVDLYAQYKSIKKEIDNAIKDVICDSAFVGGPYVEKLEDRIAGYCNSKYAVALNSGTDALYLSLWALGIKQGDEVITTPFTFVATAEVIALLGAKPVFVDIQYDTFNIDPNLIEEKITKKTKAIIPVDLFGQPAQLDIISRIAKKHNLYVVEDACQAIGADFMNKRIGSISDITCFSFFPSKNLGAYGDGGIVTTNSKKISQTIRMLKNHGSIVKYKNEVIGISSRLDGIQANILLSKINHLDKWNEKRRRIALTYSRLLKDTLPIEISSKISNIKHVYHQYTIRIKKGKRDILKTDLDNAGIQTMIYYPTPLHLLKAMRYLGYKKGDFPVAEAASKEVLSLPIYPELRLKEIQLITNSIKNHV